MQTRLPSIAAAPQGQLMQLVQLLSFYSPLLICMSVAVFSLFTVTVKKAFVFFVWVCLVTFLRVLAFKGLGGNHAAPHASIPAVCMTGTTEMFLPKDVTYSMFLLTFTLTYFVMPMVMLSVQSKTNVMNYGVLAFFVAYLLLDVFVKSSLSCVSSMVSKGVLLNVMGGLGLGGIVAGLIMYGTSLKSYLFINEMNANKEVCSRPSKQQFKCRVFKNGELVGTV